MKRSSAQKLADAIRVEIVNFVNFTGEIIVEPLASETWASITFTGERHGLRLGLRGPGAVGTAADLLDRLDDLEISIPGLLLADLILSAQTRSGDGSVARLDLEALLIDA